MPTVSRDFSITYGAQTVGGSSDVLLHGPYSLDVNEDRLSLQFSAIVSESSDAAFNTTIAALEAEFKKPYQDLSIVIGSTTYNYRTGSNEILNTRASITKPASSQFHSALSREYVIAIEGELPYDLSGENGLKITSVSVSKDASSRRTVTLTGAYTALSGNDAKAQYDARIATDATTFLDAVDNTADTWELIKEETDIDKKDKGIDFVRAYVERFKKQSISANDVAAIKNPVLSITPIVVGPGDYDKKTTRPIEVIVNYSCSVDADQTKDLKTLFVGTIKPFLLAEVRAITNGTTVGVTESSPSYDETQNTISVELSVLVISGSKLIESTLSIVDSDSLGIQLVPVWDGNPHSKFIMPSAAVYSRQITRTVTVLGTAVDAEAAAANLPALAFNLPGAGLAGSNLAGGAISKNEVPTFGAAFNGDFVPVARQRGPARETVIGVKPDTYRIAVFSESISLVYVADPSGSVGGTVSR